jgi:hypothetical protein
MKTLSLDSGSISTGLLLTELSVSLACKSVLYGEPVKEILLILAVTLKYNKNELFNPLENIFI